MKILEFILLICLALMLVLLVYPLIAWLRSILLKRPVAKSDQFIQPVSIIIACSNEELYIREKIESFLDKREWIEGSEIIVMVNNSSDATGEVLKEYMNNSFVSVFFEQGESSKILAVNNGVKRSKNQFLVFSDCRQKMKVGSVKQLMSNFNDPQVGTVNSTLMDKNETERFSFRSVLNFISDCESQSGSSLNVFGALYAQRKDVFREFPGDLLFDDLFVTVSTLVQKKRLVSEKQAIIYDVPFEDYYQVNRIRRLARGLLIFLFSQFELTRQLPKRTFVRFMVFKYLKLLLPFVLLVFLFDLIYLILNNDMPIVSILLLLLTLIVLVLKPCRRLFIHFFQINYHFMIATLQFLFFNNRTNKWDELKVQKVK